MAGFTSRPEIPSLLPRPHSRNTYDRVIGDYTHVSNPTIQRVTRSKPRKGNLIS
jgi:hypothetical protein